MSEQRERRLISEWAAQRHPQDVVTFNCPLGSIHEDLANVYGQLQGLQKWRSWRMKADAVIRTKTTIVVAEAKIYEIKSAIGDLLIYNLLLPHTPELQPYLPRTIDLVMVTPWITPTVQELATATGIRLELFSPDWVKDYVEEHSRYFTRPYQKARSERKALRAALGVE
jgi:hypothetical protein